MITLKDSQHNDAQIFGLLGHNISYSLSPAIHNHFFSKHEVNAVYGLFDIDPDNFDNNVKSLIEGTRGINVTVPYKERIIPLLDGIRNEADLTGSVNLVFEGEGYNTDYLALEKLVNKTSSLHAGDHCIILGAGGAARTASFMFGKLGMKLKIMNRNHERGRKLAKELELKGFDSEYAPLQDEASGHAIKSQCVVNCLSSGSVNFPSIDADLVIDFNYGEKSISFRNSVVKAGKLIRGEEILIEQAIYSQMIWNNMEPTFTELAEVINVK